MFSDRVGSENQERSRRKGMRREGRQHGLVSCVITSSTRNRVVNKFDCLPAAGTFQKVSCKPTNHSKFTGALCDDGCRALPATKSKGKAKGTHKLKSHDVSMNQKFIAWRIMDKPKQHNYIGLSVTEILDGLIRDDPHDYDDPLEEEGAEFSDEIALNDGEMEVPNVADVDYAVAGESGELYEVHDHGDGDDDDDDDDDPLEEEEGAEFSDEIALNGGEIEVPNIADVDYAVAGESGEVYEVHDHADDDDDDDDYDLVFYNVEMDYEREGEEGWCLVEEETC